jgi:hypothetical protein
MLPWRPVAPAGSQDEDAAPMPEDVDPDNLRVIDDIYADGRRALEEGASVLENPYPNTGHLGRAWFSGWIDALADRLDGGERAARAYPLLMVRDEANPF